MSAQIVDMKLDSTSGDIWLETGTDGLPVGGGAMIEDKEVVMQRLKVRLQTFLGTWFLDRTKGVAYYGNILGVKTPDPAKMNAIIVDCIKNTPGVMYFEAPVSYELDSALRLLKYDFTVVTVVGKITLSMPAPTGSGW